jgi:hypothetical protein
MDPHDNFIYPTAFNPCILRCSTDESGGKISTLFQEHTFDTMYVQLAFTDKIFGQGSTFRCDFMEARDGGLPFLLILDVLNIGSNDLLLYPYTMRLELLRQIISDTSFFDIRSLENEFRVRVPPLFNIDRVQELIDIIIPNFYGIAHGVAFTKDSFRGQLKNEKNVYIMRKTRFPEIYELFSDGIVPIPGNNVAYVPTLELSRKLKTLFSNRNSVKVPCVFHADRQKWVPQLL